jgi:hypothetical protein
MDPIEEKKCCETKKGRCICRMMPGLFVLLAGIAILLRALNVLQHTPFWIIISIIVILAGLQWMAAGMCKCCDKS